MPEPDRRPVDRWALDQVLRGILAKFTKTKEGYVLFGFAAQTEQYGASIFYRDLSKKPLSYPFHDGVNAVGILPQIRIK